MSAKSDKLPNHFVSISINSRQFVFIDQSKYGIVWLNVFLFTILHVVYAFGLIHLFMKKLWLCWIFGYVYSIFGGIGVTCGAHRLWSHRSYSAKLPLRIFLMICHSIAGQNDLLTWCRDHRMHHKYSETDADPHNSKRGFLFCHCGWLMTKKHPSIHLNGHKVDISDLSNDAVVSFQRRFYPFFYLTFCFVLPTLICHHLLGASWFDSWLIGSFGRYIVSLHCTWFVNSAAHMWGDRPYNLRIEPRENSWVSYATWGEGFHNFHHTYPSDYTIAENGFKLDPMKNLIDIWFKMGLAYDLKRAPIAIKNKSINNHHNEVTSFTGDY